MSYPRDTGPGDGTRDNLLRRYLLGQLDAEDAAAVELEALADGERFELLLAAEAELYDEHARGELTGEDLRRFETRLASDPEGAARRDFAAALARRADRGSTAAPEADGPAAPKSEAPAVPLEFPGAERKTTGRSRSVHRGLALAATLLLAVGAWLGVRVLQLDQATDRLEAERAALLAERAALTQELADLKGAEGAGTPEGGLSEGAKAAAPPVTVSFLVAAAVRGGPASVFDIGDGVDVVELQVEVEGGDVYVAFGVELRGPRGVAVWSSRDPGVERGPWGAALTAPVPAPVFGSSGRYRLAVEGRRGDGVVEEIGTYALEIRRP
ncbi:MAG: hypothetical protein AAGD06_06960 [Acidobacteriota bacterium]